MVAENEGCRHGEAMLSNGVNGLVLRSQRRLAQMRIIKNKIHLYSVERKACRPYTPLLAGERAHTRHY
ncbi:hypothetical protein Pcaca04_12670 [Pectobacterium carotovorum subsp. carotovorum]|nr:hypothetical protein Pcaca04_12670 [Pectobacterium carotovorum subsp. carotovorum]